MPKYEVKISARVGNQISDTMIIEAPNKETAGDWAYEEFYDRHCTHADFVDWDDEIVQEVK